MEARYQAWRSTYLRSCPQGLYCFYNGKVSTPLHAGAVLD